MAMVAMKKTWVEMKTDGLKWVDFILLRQY